MQFSVENVGKLERKLTVRFPAERFESQVSARIAEMSRTVRLKGFRPGKVPANVIQQRFGAQVRGEVLSDLIGSTLREAFEKENLRPVANPAIDTTGQPENGEIAYIATFEVMPEFPDIDVHALEISRPVAEVTDADVEKMIETLRQQRRSFHEVERPSVEGDFVMFEYDAVAGDYRFPAEGQERAGSVLGSGTLFKALEGTLTNRKAGEVFESEIEFPADFRNEQLAGKSAQVHFTVVKVQEPRLPEVNADFIALFGIDDGDMEHFRKEVRANLERELNVTGIANMLSGVFGGYTGCISVSRSVLNCSAGGSGRLSGLTVAMISLLMLALAPPLLGYMPKFVLGGLLLYLGGDTLHKWTVQSRQRLSRTEYVSLLAIIVIILQWGFIAGVLIGVVIGCAAFALSASRINPIKYSFEGSEYRSSLDRSREAQALLTTHGSEIQGLNLQSYLFFGSANRLYQHVKALLARRPQCRFLVFDFKLVTGIDSSAAYSFAQIKRAAHDRGIKLVLVHLPALAEKALRSSEFISQDVLIMPELDHALEWCENEIIAQHQGRAQEEANLRDWFAQILGTEDDATELMRRCERIEVEAGQTVVSAGEAADSMHFILDGRVGIMLGAEQGGMTRVRSLGRYTTIGEMGLVAQTPRSATIQAETDSVLYVLNTEQFEAITRERPALAQKLLTYFVTVMAERLSFANRTIAVLRR
jgi:CRP-like cAMP-binding protein/FKBP-type peptidyl-prolyl cis-trans isomerase 2